MKSPIVKVIGQLQLNLELGNAALQKHRLNFHTSYKFHSSVNCSRAKTSNDSDFMPSSSHHLKTMNLFRVIFNVIYIVVTEIIESFILLKTVQDCLVKDLATYVNAIKKPSQY